MARPDRPPSDVDSQRRAPAEGQPCAAGGPPALPFASQHRNASPERQVLRRDKPGRRRDRSARCPGPERCVGRAGLEPATGRVPGCWWRDHETGWGLSGLDTACDTGWVSGRLYPGSVIDLQAAAPGSGTGVIDGQVITRRWIVDLILDLAGYTAERDLAVRNDAQHPLPNKG